MKYEVVKYKGIEYLDYYLSDEYPTIEEVASKFKIQVLAVTKAIKFVIKKYGKKDYNRCNLEYISRKELLEILNIAKEAITQKAFSRCNYDQ